MQIEECSKHGADDFVEKVAFGADDENGGIDDIDDCYVDESCNTVCDDYNSSDTSSDVDEPGVEEPALEVPLSITETK